MIYLALLGETYDSDSARKPKEHIIWLPDQT